MARRVVAAYARRFEEEGDEAELQDLLQLPRLVDKAIEDAIASIRSRGDDVNWAYIGRMAGITRQAARQRWDARAAEVQAEGRRRRAAARATSRV
jgi:hypothetical protein